MKSQDEQWLLDEKYKGEKTAGFYTDCKRLAGGEPLGYLIGHVPFLDCTIYLSPAPEETTVRPLVPRVETEFWVEQAIAAMKELRGKQPDLFATEQAKAPVAEAGETSQQAPPKGLSEERAAGLEWPRQGREIKVLDLCAGSGCIGVAVAKHLAEARVDFVEIDARLHPIIERNITANIDDPTRCQVYHSNLYEGLPFDQTYEVILSNPPYLDPALNRVATNVKDFEPHLALFGGKQGTEIIEAIIASAPHRLTPGGQLWLEHEPEQVGALAALARDHGFQVTHHHDQYNVLRYSVLVLK